MIVADTNVIAYLVLESPYTALAADLYARDPDWAVPLLWRSELRSVLIHYVRQGHLSLSEAIRIQREAEEVFREHEYDVPSPEVLRLSAESGCSPYDCEFVALAHALGVPLITMDRKLHAAFPETSRLLDPSR